MKDSSGFVPEQIVVVVFHRTQSMPLISQFHSAVEHWGSITAFLFELVSQLLVVAGKHLLLTTLNVYGGIPAFPGTSEIQQV